MNLDKDKLAVDIFADIIPSYPTSAEDNYIIEDTSYISALLLKHLRLTGISEKTLERNSSFFRTSLKNYKFTNRNTWITSLKKALEYYFPINQESSS